MDESGTGFGMETLCHREFVNLLLTKVSHTGLFFGRVLYSKSIVGLKGILCSRDDRWIRQQE